MGGTLGYQQTTQTELIDPNGLTIANGPNFSTPPGVSTATLLADGSVLVIGSQGSNATAQLYVTGAKDLPNLTSITITAPPTLAKGTGTHFVATGHFADGSTQQLNTLSWSSSDNTIAQISNDLTNRGACYGVAAGTVTITATVGSISGTTTVTVTP